MTIKPTIVVKVIYNDLDKLPAQLKRGAREVIDRILRMIVFEVKESMRAPKSGRSYRRGSIRRKMSASYKGLRTTTTKSGTYAIIGAKIHRASAPGEAPAVDYGNLINSVKEKREDMTGYVYTNADYAEVLETRRHRPFFKPAVDKLTDSFIKQMDAVVKGLGR